MSATAPAAPKSKGYKGRPLGRILITGAQLRPEHHIARHHIQGEVTVLVVIGVEVTPLGKSGQADFEAGGDHEWIPGVARTHAECPEKTKEL